MRRHKKEREKAKNQRTTIPLAKVCIPQGGIGIMVVVDVKKVMEIGIRGGRPPRPMAKDTREINRGKGVVVEAKAKERHNQRVGRAKARGEIFIVGTRIFQTGDQKIPMFLFENQVRPRSRQPQRVIESRQRRKHHRVEVGARPCEGARLLHVRRVTEEVRVRGEWTLKRKKSLV